MSDEPLVALKEFLSYHLRQQRSSQRELAMYLDYDPTNFSHMLNGRRPLFSPRQEDDIALFFEWRQSNSKQAELIAELHQLAAKARRVAIDVPPPRLPVALARTNVLPPETPLFGRQTELDEIKRLLSAERRLVTLTGSGGVGKTRLALAVALEMVGHFRDGVWFVDLSAVTEPERVPLVIAQVLEQSAKIDATVAVQDRLLELVQGKEMLLVLDNFEHVMSQAALASDLRQVSPGLKLLITSRERLHLTGEYVIDVGPLNVTSDYPRAVENPGVALFLERATMSGFSLDLTSPTLNDILTLCRRLDGLPLAIELAAAQLHYRGSVAAVLADLASRIQWSGPRDQVARHQTLFQTIGWSYKLLSPREQWLFRWMAVFAGGMTDAALRALAPQAPGDSGVSDSAPLDITYLLLVDKSLLHRSDTLGPDVRWRMLPNTREYALLQLRKDAAEQRAARQWHADYFWRMAVREPEEGASLLPTVLAGRHSDAEQQWLRQMVAERENLWAALDWFSDEGPLERGLRMTSRLREYWVWFGMVDQGRTYLETFIRAGDAARVEALYVAGQLAGRQGDFTLARQWYEGALVLVRRIGNKTEEARIYNDLGVVAFLEGQYDLAGGYYRQSLTVREALDDKEGQAKTLNNLGLLYLALGQYDMARQALERSITLRRALNDPSLLALGLNTLGDLCLSEGRVADARAALNECLSLSLRLGRPEVDVDMLDSLAHLAFLSQRLERASVLLAASDARRSQRRWPRSVWDNERIQRLTSAMEEALGAERRAEVRDTGPGLDDLQIMALAQAEARGEPEAPLSTSPATP